MSAGLSAGDWVGPYLVLFPLGKGGMGEVWAAARQQSGLGFTKLIALKILTAQEIDENDVLMFIDEAKAASALEHASIVPTVDLGRAGTSLYIAMDLVRGPSLTALLQRLVVHEDTLTPAIVAHIGIQLSRALDYAYERANHQGQRLRLVHRDVSPHNVLLDLNGCVRLSDFGVARTAIQDHWSRVGTVRGKPSYMAPEQVAAGSIDARTDIFSLGIVLYESASLRRLFGRKSPVKSMDAVVRYNPKPLDTMVPGFPRSLAQVIARALEKRPEDRFPSSGAFADALEEVSRHLPGIATASLDLVRTIESHFEPDAFDVEARAQEGLEMARRRDRTRILPGLGSAELLESGQDLTRVWPTSESPDPLAPEAIEALRTQLPLHVGAHLQPESDLAPPVVQAPPMPTLRPGTDTRSGSSSYTGGAHRRLDTTALLLVLVAVALVAVVSLAIVTDRRRARSQPQETAASSRFHPRPPVVAAQPVRVEGQLDEGEKNPTQAEVGPKGPPSKKKPVRRTFSRKAMDKPRAGAGRGRREASKKLAPVAADATFNEVRDLIRRVTKVEPIRGRAMFATLAEAGGSNVATLNRLRSEAEALLRKQEP